MRKRTGIRATRGSDKKTFTNGSKAHSTGLYRPISSPRTTPTTIDGGKAKATLMRLSFNASRKRVLVQTSSTAPKTAVTGGNAGDNPSLPITSQMDRPIANPRAARSRFLLLV
jgi:hypothetical protein